MTEAEAKNKRCCGGAGCGSLTIAEATWKYQIQQLDSFNLLPRMCIGSECMAWLWDHSNTDVDGHCGLVERSD